jgi:ABC-type Fe3+/spermidine/putrescine transport system ATPase subunit
MAEQAVELTGVTKKFGDDFTAVDGLDLVIEDGEFFSLLGPSGCG